MCVGDKGEVRTTSPDVVKIAAWAVNGLLIVGVFWLFSRVEEVTRSMDVTKAILVRIEKAIETKTDDRYRARDAKRDFDAVYRRIEKIEADYRRLMDGAHRHKTP